MGHTPKGKCTKCGKNLKLDRKGQEWVVPSHNLRVLGPNPECPGSGKLPQP